jgi:hypothetical protein
MNESNPGCEFVPHDWLMLWNAKALFSIAKVPEMTAVINTTAINVKYVRYFLVTVIILFTTLYYL